MNIHAPTHAWASLPVNPNPNFVRTQPTGNSCTLYCCLYYKRDLWSNNAIRLLSLQIERYNFLSLCFFPENQINLNFFVGGVGDDTNDPIFQNHVKNLRGTMFYVCQGSCLCGTVNNRGKVSVAYIAMSFSTLQEKGVEILNVANCPPNLAAHH